VERKMFKALQEKVTEHLLLTSMFDKEIKE
jgi:hypothetical protein